ncbi:asparaginase domain-containing protein [Arhodomonas sp. KWT2]|uniref:asparaginase domain-containing protein n=1 Tax=unclassified Arhodomonas TaxID=2621637 RepID=UPI001969E2D7|nr:asparaginase domain-containing protein [Arhodomonas sp. KWT]
MSGADDGILVLATGGTFDKVYADALSEFRVGEPQAPGILEQARVDVAWRVEAVLAKDSLELTDADRRALRARVEASGARRVIITHGTDTMAETAEALAGGDGRTIVLVGAMQPARMRETDAPFNLGFALAAVQLLVPGVYIAMNGRVFEAGRVRKDRRAGRFEATPPRG